MGEYADEAIERLIWRSGTPHRDPRRTTAEKGSELAKLRILAHQALDYHWKFKGTLSRSGAYARLARDMSMQQSACHIGMFNEEQCRQVVEVCSKWAD